LAKITKFKDLQFAPSQSVMITVHTGNEYTLAGTIVDVVDRKLLITLDGPVPTGAAVMAAWNGNIVLGEVHGWVPWSGAQAFVIGVEQIVCRTAAEVEFNHDSETLAEVDARSQTAAVRRMLFAIRMSALKLNEGKFDAFQRRIEGIEQRLDHNADGRASLQVSEEALKAVPEYRKEMVEEMRSQVAELRNVLEVLAQAMTMFEASGASGWEAQSVDGTIFECLLSVDLRFQRFWQTWHPD
jgi:hypothetical protein